MSQSRICVVIPTYNDASRIVNLIERTNRFTDDVIVVNDGSTDNTLELIHESNVRCQVVSYERNRGKGYALVEGFKAAIHGAYEYALTFDSSGMYLPEDIPLFIRAFQGHKQALLLGVRGLFDDGTLRVESIASRMANDAFFFQTGKRVLDALSAFRLYPLSKMSKSWMVTTRYESELELLVYAAWRDIPIVNVPIHVQLSLKQKPHRILRRLKDTIRIFGANILLTFGAVFYFLPASIIRGLRHTNR